VVARGGIVARLAGIYGPGRSFVLKNLLESKSAIEGYEGSGRAINQIHREDAAAALKHLIENKCRGTFNVVDDAPCTQRECFEWLAPLFSLPLPPEAPPNPDRKRGNTHKFVSNAKLKATSWTALYPSYRDAVHHDPLLVSSILDIVMTETGTAPAAPTSSSSASWAVAKAPWAALSPARSAFSSSTPITSSLTKPSAAFHVSLSAKVRTGFPRA